MKMKRWKIAGINFDHFHMGDLLRYAHEHPQVEIVGISDEQTGRMEEAVRKLGISRHRVFTDHRACLEKTKPDIVILCPAASKHGEWVKKVAPHGVHIMVEKPFAASLKEADTMVKAMPARLLSIRAIVRRHVHQSCHDAGSLNSLHSSDSISRSER
jgi:glucose-fructose oxidoreductase